MLSHPDDGAGSSNTLGAPQQCLHALGLPNQGYIRLLRPVHRWVEGRGDTMW